jgi:hypothetical protein
VDEVRATDRDDGRFHLVTLFPPDGADLDDVVSTDPGRLAPITLLSQARGGGTADGDGPRLRALVVSPVTATRRGAAS